MTEDKRNFDLKYLLVGDGKKDWYKALGNGWRIAAILIVVILLVVGSISLWRSIFGKPQVQNTTFSGAVGKVNIIQNTKKSFIPFVEGGVEKNTAGHRDFDSYIRAGLRFEF